MINTRGFKALALAALAAPTLLFADTAHGAYLWLRSAADNVHTCQATVWNRNGNQVVAQSAYRRVDAEGAAFDLGAHPAGAGGDVPSFGALQLSCWNTPSFWPHVAPPALAPSSSLTLDFQDSAWEVLAAGSEQVARMLPRDGRVLSMQLELTPDPLRPLRIAQAWLRVGLEPRSTDVAYGPFMQRLFDAD